jgi:hypothetical protein
MKKTFTKTMAMALAFILLFGSAAAGFGGFADMLDSISVRARAATIEDLTYTVENGEVTITGCNKDAKGELVVPDEIEGYPVTSIGHNAFSGCNKLTVLTIGNSVKSIGGSAFVGCYELANIKLGDNITKIGDLAFFGTAFYNDEANWEGDELYIGDYLIESENVTGDFVLKSNVKCISDGGLPLSANLTSISVSDGNTVYHAAGNCLIETESKRMILGCKNSVIPDDGSVTSIGFYAFYGGRGLVQLSEATGCVGLTEITIPDSVETIEEGAFFYCTDLSNITIPVGVNKIEMGAFEYCEKLKDIFYGGTELDKGEISIGRDNTYLLNATWHYTDIILNNAKLNAGSDEVYKNSKVTVTATAENVPEGYCLAVYDGGNEPVAKGSNKEVAYEVPDEIKADKTLTVKVVDENGNVPKNSEGKDLSENIEIKVKTGFIDIIIAFFKKLFRLNTVTIEP